MEKYGKNLVGNDEERAVSPVIGVILMVAITVILAAVIAAFVMDLGDSVSQDAQAGVSVEGDSVTVTSLGDGTVGVYAVSGDHYYGTDGEQEDLESVTAAEVGDTINIANAGPSDTVNVVAFMGDLSEPGNAETETVVRTIN